MKFIGKIFIFMSLLAGGAVYGAELEERAAQKKLDEQLIEAVDARLTDQVRTLLLQKANPDCRDSSYEKIISHAIDNGNPDIVELLLCQRADVNQVCRFATIPLEAAILNVMAHSHQPDRADLCLHIVDLLLYHRADPNNDNFGISPLVHCIGYINNWGQAHDRTQACNLAGLLLKYEADDTVTNEGKKTIHDLAAENPELQGIIDYQLKDCRAKIKQALAEALPQRVSLDVVGVVAGYVI